MTEGNTLVDSLAKATARQEFSERLRNVTAFLLRAVNIPSHLVSTLVSRKDKLFMQADPAFEDVVQPFKDFRISQCCLCLPTSCIRSTRSVRLCNFEACPTRGRSMVLGNVESMFQRLQRAVLEGTVPKDLSDKIWRLHPRFKASVEFVGCLSAPLLPHDCEGTCLRGCLVSSQILHAMCEFICDGCWKWGTKRTTDRVTWAVLFADFVACFGMFPGLFHVSMRLGVISRRFRDLFLTVRKRLGGHVDTISGMRHAKSLGFGTLGGISAARHCKHPKRVLSWCLSISRQLHSLQKTTKQKPLASISPSWEELNNG